MTSEGSKQNAVRSVVARRKTRGGRNEIHQIFWAPGSAQGLLRSTFSKGFEILVRSGDVSTHAEVEHVFGPCLVRPVSSFSFFRPSRKEITK